jgi:hypothetical protein
MLLKKTAFVGCFKCEWSIFFATSLILKLWSKVDHWR